MLALLSYTDLIVFCSQVKSLKLNYIANTDGKIIKSNWFKNPINKNNVKSEVHLMMICVNL